MTSWCVIGAGGIADRRTIPAIMKDEDFRLVAVMDKFPEVAKRIGEIYGDGGYIVCEGTLGQTESGRLRHLYAPQGEYEAMQDRRVGEPVFYEGDGGDLYVKQLRAFGDILASGENDYTFAERAVHIQELVDMIYADAGIGPNNN